MYMYVCIIALTVAEMLNVMSHLLYQSLLNQSHSTAYYLAVSHIVAVGLIGYSLFTAGARPSSLRHFFLR